MSALATTKTIKNIENWYIQRTESGWCLSSVCGVRTTNIQRYGKNVKERPIFEQGDLVETKNTVYWLGLPALVSNTI